jgi:hypothetical protein
MSSFILYLLPVELVAHWVILVIALRLRNLIMDAVW